MFLRRDLRHKADYYANKLHCLVSTLKFRLSSTFLCSRILPGSPLSVAVAMVNSRYTLKVHARIA